MKTLSEEQLETLLGSIPQKRVEDDFSDIVMSKVMKNASPFELTLFRILSLASSLLLTIVSGWLLLLLFSTLSSNGFVDFIQLLFTLLLSREMGIIEAGNMLISLVPMLTIAAIIVSVGLLFFSTSLYRKLRFLQIKQHHYGQ